MLGELFPFDWLERAFPLPIVKLTRDSAGAASLAADMAHISAAEKACGLLEREIEGANQFEISPFLSSWNFHLHYAPKSHPIPIQGLWIWACFLK